MRWDLKSIWRQSFSENGHHSRFNLFLSRDQSSTISLFLHSQLFHLNRHLTVFLPISIYTIITQIQALSNLWRTVICATRAFVNFFFTLARALHTFLHPLQQTSVLLPSFSSHSPDLFLHQLV